MTIIEASAGNDIISTGKLHAFVATRFAPASKDAKGQPQPVSYAAVVVGENYKKKLWGFGYVTFEDAARGAAYLHVKEHRAEGQSIIAHGRGLISHVGRKGTVHAAIPSGFTSKGKPYDGYELLFELALDIEKETAEWLDAPKQGGPEEYGEALGLASGEPWERAKAYLPHHIHYQAAYPRNYIIGRDDDPDPLGLLR